MESPHLSPITPESTLASGDAVGGRTSPARREVLRLLKNHLPGAVSLLNTREGLDLPTRFDFRFARKVLTGITFPAVLVESRTNSVPMAPRLYKRVVKIYVHYIAGVNESSEEIDNQSDIAELIELVLKQRQTGHLLPSEAGPLAGLRAWNTLTFEGIEELSERWDKHSGKTLTFNLDLAGCKLWPQ